MTLDELEKLIKRAEDVTGCKINLSRDSTGNWSVVSAGQPKDSDRYGVQLNDCISVLKKWATPPKPKTLTFTLQTAYCERVMNDFETDGRFVFERNGGLFNALVAALKPYQEQP